MNIREYLKNYNSIGDEIRRLNEELNRHLGCREDTYNTLQAQVICDMPRTQRLDGDDPVSKAAITVIARFSKTIDHLTTQINNLLDQKDMFNKIWCQLNLLNHEERRVIELRYFCSLSWEQVAQRMIYCQRQCKRLAASAINALQKSIDGRYINDCEANK